MGMRFRGETEGALCDARWPIAKSAFSLDE